ncbi:MAG: precorrin-6y C5,15-methyltransferase (decarboxylating) subunit CbiE [Deferribacterales bacterium]
MKDSEITVISTGPGAEDMITVRALNAIKEQDIIVGTDLAVKTFAKGLNCYIPEKMLTDTIDFINTCVYKKVGVLVSGDAGFFSLAKTISEKYDNVSIIPGVSSISAGFSLLKKQWGGFEFHSAHGRELFDHEITRPAVILCDAENTPDKVLEKHSYMRSRFKITILKDVSLQNEHVFHSPQKGYNSSRLLLILEDK